MPRRPIRLFLAAALLSLTACSQQAHFPPNTLSLTGHVDQPATWTAQQIKTTFAKDIQTIQYTLKGEKHSAHAVPLLALVNAAGPALDSKIKNDQLHLVVIVQGSDGYAATFALAELSPDGGNRDAWIALDMDDKPLPDRNAPANLIIPADQKPERWVRGIQSIRIADIAKSRE